MRDPLHRIPVKYKLALVFLTLCILAFGVGGYVVLGAARGALVSEISARVDEQSRAWAAALDADLRALASRTQDFASDGYLRERAERLLALPGPRDAGLGRELCHQLERKKPLVEAFAGIALVDQRGETFAATRGVDPEFAASVGRATLGADGLVFGDLHRQAPDQSPTLAISVPLLSLDGGVVLGRLVNFVHAGIWVTRAISNAGLSKQAPQEAVQLNVTDPGGATLRVSNVLTGSNAPPPDSDLVRSGFGLTIGSKPERVDAGAARASWPMAAPGWTAGVQRSGPPDLSSVAALQSRMLAFGIVLAAISLLLLYFPMRYLAQPLVRLREAARRIEGGDFGARVDVESSDEIGQLARAFNTMAQAIEERTRRLEKSADALAAGQSQLRRESDRLAAVIASMRDGLVVLDAGGHPVLSNAAAGPLLDLIGREKRASNHHNCKEVAAHASCTECLTDPAGAPRSCVVDFGGKVLEVHATRLPGSGGPTGRVLVSRDVTDRIVQDERQIHQERLAVIGEVASIMAHELNNPLAAISMFSQMMEQDLPGNSPLHEPVAVIRRNIESCKRAIREVLDYATDATPEVSPVDVHAVLEDVSRFLRPMRERAGVAWAAEFGAVQSVVTGDEVQLRQIFVNLCMNAIQAMAARGGSLRVVTRDSGDWVEVDVVDQGPGIPPEARDEVFRPFFTTKPRGEGTGLGLPTARRIAEIHGGNVDVASTGPGGTTFRVRLRARSEVAV